MCRHGTETQGWKFTDKPLLPEVVSYSKQFSLLGPVFSTDCSLNLKIFVIFQNTRHRQKPKSKFQTKIDFEHWPRKPDERSNPLEVVLLETGT